ncbi:MAG: hypothetical protein PHG97_00055 [Candidatus Margulisbacteria bacterium]|nr:hypothetical protein [Candidatus Margulisiibacteriota bacterium]
MKKILLGIFLVLIAQTVWANHSAMIGGARDGLGLGMATERSFTDYFTGRFGVEATTGEDLTFAGDNPFLIFAGLKMPLVTIKDEPIAWGFGFVGNYGARTEQGEYLSLIFEKLYNNDAYFLETGLDWFGDHGHVEAQVGYRFLSY